MKPAKKVTALLWFCGWMITAIGCGFLIGVAQTKGFRVHTVHYLDSSGVIVSDESHRPVYGRFDIQGNLKSYQFCIRGKEVALYTTDNDGKLRGSAHTFYDKSGEPRIVWVDKSGTGEFTDREMHEDGKVRKEVLINGIWRPTASSNGIGFVVIEGNWFRAKFTNGVWQIQDQQGNPNP